MDREFPFGIFRPPEKQDYLSDVPLITEIFHLNDPEKSCSVNFPTRFFEFFFVNDNHCFANLKLFLFRRSRCRPRRRC